MPSPMLAIGGYMDGHWVNHESYGPTIQFPIPPKWLNDFSYKPIPPPYFSLSIETATYHVHQMGGPGGESVYFLVHDSYRPELRSEVCWNRMIAALLKEPGRNGRRS